MALVSKGRKEEQMKIFKYERAFEVLQRHGRKWGVDTVVDDPAGVIKNHLNVQYSTALSYLKELEHRGFVVLQKEGVGDAIQSLRILKKELPVRAHEKDEETRFIDALWKYRRPSICHPGKFIVHANFFEDVHGDADIHQTRLYSLLNEFIKKGWLVAEWKKNAVRFLFVEFTDSFPKCNV